MLRRLAISDRRDVARPDWLDTDRVYRRTMQMYRDSGYGFWVMMYAADMRFAGLCGLLEQDVDEIRELEVGYHLLPAYRGRGLATEAARAVMDYAFITLRKSRLISIILPDNHASIAVAERNGMQYEKDSVFRQQTVRIYSATADGAAR
jgi:RimJ/RimL family protein N-acetyltransferase